VVADRGDAGDRSGARGIRAREIVAAASGELVRGAWSFAVRMAEA